MAVRLTPAGGWSTPRRPTRGPPRGGVAQLVRALACHARGRGFKSRHSRHSFRALVRFRAACAWRSEIFVSRTALLSSFPERDQSFIVRARIDRRQRCPAYKHESACAGFVVAVRCGVG